jgi:hypothetical protein
MCSFTRKSGFALRITFFGLSVLVGALPIACRTPQKKITTDEFFESLLVGGAHNGKIYIELSLTPELFSKTKTREDRWAVWEAFFKKAILEQPPAADSQKFDIAPYWGEYVFEKEKIDRAYIAKSVNLQVGDQIHIRTDEGSGSARIIEYAIHYGGPAIEGNILLAVAEPRAKFKVMETHLLVASKEPFRCRTSCANHRTVPDQKTSTHILDALAKGLKKSEKDKVTEFVALQGSFTVRNAVQYVAYIKFLEYPDYYWRTAILDSDLSVIKILGENDYAHIVPNSVGDVDGDGLEEIWTELLGSEGYNTAIFYLARDSKPPVYYAIATAYNGD